MMKRIEVSCPRIIKNDKYTRWECDISGDFLNDTIYYEVENKWSDGLCADRLDGIMVALLPYVMYRSNPQAPIHLMLDAPISERLYFQIKEELMPAMEMMEWYHDFVLDVKTTNEKYDSTAVCTSVSGGVDSFYTLLKSKNEFPKAYKVTHGIFTCMADRDKVNEAEIINAQSICKALDLELVRVNTNIVGLVYESRHDAISSFVVPSVPLILSRLFKVYYHSSSHVYTEFAMEPEGMSKVDLLLCNSFSSETLTMYSYSGAATRAEKTDYISRSPVAQKHLLVCGENDTHEGKTKNCSMCSKCTITMIDLDIAGRLDEFKQVFDVENFRKHPLYYWGYVYYKEKHGLYIDSTLEMAERKKYKIPFGSRLMGLYKIIKNGFRRTNPYQNSFRP